MAALAGNSAAFSAMASNPSAFAQLASNSAFAALGGDANFQRAMAN
jgi:hypothetical protein